MAPCLCQGTGLLDCAAGAAAAVAVRVYRCDPLSTSSNSDTANWDHVSDCTSVWSADDDIDAGDDVNKDDVNDFSSLFTLILCIRLSVCFLKYSKRCICYLKLDMVS